MQQQKQLPTLEDLQADPNEAYKADQFNWLMNQEPPANWIATHPLVKVKNELNQQVPMKYLPIDKVEYLMTRVFKKWYVEILSTQSLFNAVVVSVRVHYMHPEGEWRHTDGVGASGVQTDKDAKASDLSSIKLAAVQMAAPSAESYAIKDACEKIGKIFGRDLSRRNTINYEPFEPPQQPQPGSFAAQQPQYGQPPIQQQPWQAPPTTYPDQPAQTPWQAPFQPPVQPWNPDLQPGAYPPEQPQQPTTPNIKF